MMWWLTQHLVVAAVLTGAVLAITRWRSPAPAVTHAMWLVVLIKLLVPPMIAWPWTPLSAPANARNVASSIAEIPAAKYAAQEIPNGTNAPAPPPAATTALWISPSQLAITIWASGAIIVIVWRLIQAIRLWWMVGRGWPAPDGLQREFAKAASLFGMAPPPIRMVPGLAAPGIWCTFRHCLLWPSHLPSTLSPQVLRGVMLHELAHLRRRDHLTAWLVLVGEIVWWWNPCYWITRRRLEENAELACDAWVLERLPHLRREYADALVTFAATPSRTLQPQPALGLHSTQNKTFTRRLTMIMDDTRSARRLSRWQVWSLALLGIAVLPAWARGNADETTPVPSPTAATAAAQQDALPDSEPPTIYIDRRGKLHPSGVAREYLDTLLQVNPKNPTRPLEIVVDIRAKNEDIEEQLDELLAMGFSRDQLIVRRNRDGQPPLKSFFTTQSYAVSDIVVPSDTRMIMETAKAKGHANPNQFLKQEEVDQGLETLSELIVSTIAPDSWLHVGGAARISKDKTNIALVIWQANATHDEIKALLSQIRQSQLKGAEAYFNYLQNRQKSDVSAVAESSPRPALERTKEDGQLMAVSYAAADLLGNVPLEDFFSLSKEQRQEKIEEIKKAFPNSQLPIHELADVIVETTGMTNWEKGAGRGRISGFETTLSLVIVQTREMHNQVADLMDAMRQANLARAFAEGDKNAIRNFARQYRDSQK